MTGKSVIEGRLQAPTVGQSAGVAVAEASGSGGVPTVPQVRQVSPENNPELFRPQSSREGVGPVKYVWWNSFYAIMQRLNKKFARDPFNRVSWDKWPPKMGVLYLLAKMRYLRSNALPDPYDDAANDNKNLGPEPEKARRGYTADGTWVSDRENPQMGAENTRFGSNIPPKKVRPDVENMTPSARETGKLKWRKLDPDSGKIDPATGKVDPATQREILQPAVIMNDLGGGWIQFQFHNFGGNTKRDPIAQNPHHLPRAEGDTWPAKDAIVDRTTDDPSRVTHDGRPTPVNERAQAWIQAQVYGTNDAELKDLRAFKDGLMKLDENGNLPEDPKKPGIDKTGFNNNYNPELSFLHWLFTVEHNRIAEHYKYFHPDWSDEKLFDYARKVNVAQIARIHTVQWTKDLLQHPTLQLGMQADWSGFVGERFKNYLMRMFYRHPWLGRVMKPLTDIDFIWGMPGSRWEHHDGPFQVPKHFRLVYRLHEMVLGEHEIIEPGTDRTLDRISLINFVHHNTRPIVEKFGYGVLAYSFVRKSAGALKLHNFPRALTQFKNQQNEAETDLAELDIFRERTDGTGTYNEFRKSVGEPPVTSFMELTGGDAELAKELEIKYEGLIDKVDAGIGILAEPKPAGFALSYTQFYQFILNAPRRVKSNRHLTEYFTLKDYEPEGVFWVEHAGGMLGAMARNLKDRPYGKDVIAAMEGVTRAFAPWLDTETFPLRTLETAQADSGNILKSQMRTLALGAVAAAAAVHWGAAGLWPAILAVAALTLPLTQFYKRMLAWRFMQKTWQRAYTDKRTVMFPTLFKGEKWAHRSVVLGKLGALAVMDGAGMIAKHLLSVHPVIALLVLGVSLSGLGTWSRLKTYKNDMEVLKVSLLTRMRKGQEITADASKIPGATALQKRYWFLATDGKPVAEFVNTYGSLKDHGLPPFRAFMTAVLSHLDFGPKSQKGMTWGEKREAGILFKPFAIYLPNLIKAQGYSNTRIFAPVDNARGITPGDVDMEEFERMFRLYAPGRDYMTAYDMARMREWNRWRDAQEGRGNPFSRFLGQFAAKRRADQLVELYADRVVSEDGKLVPAISREMLLRVYQGTAQIDIMKERGTGRARPASNWFRPGNAYAEPGRDKGYDAVTRHELGHGGPY